MTDKCGNCGCESHNNCGSKQLNKDEMEKIIKENKEKRREYTVKYRISLEDLECGAEELIDRVKAYTGIVEEVEFTEKELIISYDDRLITPAEISDLVQ